MKKIVTRISVVFLLVVGQEAASAAIQVNAGVGNMRDNNGIININPPRVADPLAQTLHSYIIDGNVLQIKREKLSTLIGLIPQINQGPRLQDKNVVNFLKI